MSFTASTLLVVCSLIAGRAGAARPGARPSLRGPALAAGTIRVNLSPRSTVQPNVSYRPEDLIALLKAGADSDVARALEQLNAKAKKRGVALKHVRLAPVAGEKDAFQLLGGTAFADEDTDRQSTEHISAIPSCRCSGTTAVIFVCDHGVYEPTQSWAVSSQKWSCTPIPPTANPLTGKVKWSAYWEEDYDDMYEGDCWTQAECEHKCLAFLTGSANASISQLASDCSPIAPPIIDVRNPLCE